MCEFFQFHDRLHNWLATFSGYHVFAPWLVTGEVIAEKNRWVTLGIGLADVPVGDSEGILQLQAFVRYAVGKDRQHGVLIGYRYKDAEFEDGSLEEDFEFKGPVAGFNFRF